MHELDRVARLALGAGLRQAHRLLVGGVGEHDVEAELGEEGVRHGEQLVQHERARDADGLLLRVAHGVVAFQVHLVDLVEECAVGRDLGGIDAGRLARFAAEVPTLEVTGCDGLSAIASTRRCGRAMHPAFAFSFTGMAQRPMPACFTRIRGTWHNLADFCQTCDGRTLICIYTVLHRFGHAGWGALQHALRLGRQQRGAHRARHREPGTHRQILARIRAKRRDDGGVVRHAALQHDALADRLGPHHLVQVVAHDRQAQARSHLGLGRALRQGGVDGRLHEHRAALAQVDGAFCRKRQRAVIGKRDAQPPGLLLDEAAGAGRAHLVHLEVGHLAVRQTDVLGILPADFEHGIDLRVGLGRAARLRRDLVAHGVGADEVADHGAPAARAAGRHHVRLISHAFGKRGKPIAHRLLGVAARAQVLRVEQHAV